MTYKIVSSVTIPHPGPGTFQPGSYQDLVGHCVTGIPGLAVDHDHLCTGVAIQPDGRGATLTIHTLPAAHIDVTRTVSTGFGRPVAHARLFTPDGELIVEGRYDAPFQTGQSVFVNGAEHVIGDVSWPNRKPEIGGVGDQETIDWQHATAHPVAPPGPTAQA